MDGPAAYHPRGPVWDDLPMADDGASANTEERSLLLTGLGLVGGAAAIGVVIGALVKGDGLAGLLIGAGIGVVVSVAALTGVALRRGADPDPDATSDPPRAPRS